MASHMPVITCSFIMKLREQGKYQVTSKSMLFSQDWIAIPANKAKT